MDVKINNKSTYSDEFIQGVVDFVSRQFPQTTTPVNMVLRSKDIIRTNGVAYGPFHSPQGGRVPNEHNVAIHIGVGGTYPVELIYKKRAGAMIYDSVEEEVVHVIAHELRHICQYEEHANATGNYAGDHSFMKWVASGKSGYKSNSCEVDAELVAHGILLAYRAALDNRKAA
jgi:hypothetical protein